MKTSILGTFVTSALLLSMSAAAAPLQISFNGAFTVASGDNADLLYETFTASYIIDSDPAAASAQQHDYPSSEPNVLNFDAWEFGGAPYGFSGATSLPSSVSLGVSGIKVYDNDTEDLSGFLSALGLADPGQSAYDIIEFHSSNTCCFDPASPLLGEPSDGSEFSLNFLMNSAWSDTNTFDVLGVPTGAYGIVFNVSTYGAIPGVETGFAAGIVDVNSITVSAVSTVPVPAAAWLFGSGLLGLIGVARRKS